MARLKASPVKALMDEVVEITVSSLKPLQSVNIVAIVVNGEDGAAFYASGEFRADASGFLDVNRSLSYRGTYVGIESMGLFWSAIPAPGQKKGLRLIKRVVNTPLDWHIIITEEISNGTIEILVSHARNCDLNADKNKEKVGKAVATPSTPSELKVNILAECTVQRYYSFPENVRQKKIRDGRLRGIIFEPTKRSSRPRSGIIDIYGGGSFKLHRATLLAERGFVVFALAYCDFDDMVGEIDVDVRYLLDAVDFVLSKRCPAEVDARGVGVVGLCKGGTLALEMASNHPKVRAAVAVNAPCFNEIGRFRRLDSDRNVALSWDVSSPYLKRSDEGVITKGLFDWFDGKTPEEKLDICVPVERASSILFIYGEDDVSIGVRHLGHFIERLKKANKNNYKCLVYPKSGHMLDPPIFPLCRASYWPLFKDVFLWGGEAKHHHHAQLDSWNQILKYFESRLGEGSDES